MRHLHERGRRLRHPLGNGDNSIPLVSSGCCQANSDFAAVSDESVFFMRIQPLLNA